MAILQLLVCHAGFVCVCGGVCVCRLHHGAPDIQNYLEIEAVAPVGVGMGMITQYRCFIPLFSITVLASSS